MTRPPDAANEKFSPPQPAREFSAESAKRYLEGICQLGPRRTASVEMSRQQQLLQRHFEALGARTLLQRFRASQPSVANPFECANLIVHG